MRKTYRSYLNELEDRRKEDHKLVIEAFNNQGSVVLVKKNKRSINDAVLSTQEADRRKTYYGEKYI